MISTFLAVAAVAAAASTPSPVEPSVPKKQPQAEILSEVVLCKQPQRYIGWPTIAKAANGDLLVAFSGDRDWHVCPWGRLFLVRSTDNGKTWSAPEAVTNTPLDDRGAAIVALPDGSLIITFETSLAFDDPKIKRYEPYRKHAAKISPEEREKWKGNWIRRSTDNGHTWGPYIKVPINTPHGPTPLSDGRLLYVRPSVYSSADGGQTWEKIFQIDRDPATWKSRYAFLSEQHAVETQPGHLIALSRYANEKKDATDNFLRQMESSDGGKTWSQPVKTPLEGYPAHLLRLQNGWILATYSRRIEPMGQRACLSKDGGKTWLSDQEIVLSNAVEQGAGDLGYPSSVQLPDGSIWSVYYQVEKTADGEFPALMATHWKIPSGS